MMCVYSVQEVFLAQKRRNGTSKNKSNSFLGINRYILVNARKLPTTD